MSDVVESHKRLGGDTEFYNEANSYQDVMLGRGDFRLVPNSSWPRVWA